jgi:hypothetical protein
MRRALAALALLAFGLALLVSTRPVDDAHAATTCTKHTKRVVAHVKRHGKRRRVAHLKHWWTCEEVAEPVVSTPAAPGSPTASAETPQVQPEPEANALGVVARDANEHFSFEPTRTSVRSGQLIVQLINEGEDEHDMDIQQVGPGGTLEGPVAKVPQTESKHQNSASLEVQPGTYRMWCTLFHHAEEGMRIEITVE